MEPIVLPNPCVVVLIGASGSGKSTFGRKHFLPTEVLSSDFCRGLASDNENDQTATDDAFEILHFIAAKRLENYRLVAVDATNVQENARKPLVQMARRFHLPAVAIVINVPESVCHHRNEGRPDRQFGPHVVHRHVQELRRSIRGLYKEGFRYVHVLKSVEAVDSVEIKREPLWTSRRDETGPFDIVGDVHGCFEELCELLGKLGYEVSTSLTPNPLSHSAEQAIGETGEGASWFDVSVPEGRKLVFLGDLVDRGPDSVSVLKLAMQMKRDGQAIVVPGNHDEKILRKLQGRDVRMAHGLQATWDQLSAEPPEFRDQVREFLDKLISHFVLDEGRLVVAHAGMKEEYAGRASGRVKEFALYGETTGETDEFGLPVRYNWAAEYRGRAKVVYGHTPQPEAEWLNGTINIDTGCVFGGRLTALRYPELEIVSVSAHRTYAESVKPFLDRGTGDLGAQHQIDDVLDLQDVMGKRLVETSLRGNITIQEENATAALEVMSRFATNPKWLVYLPPTMSPTETSRRTDLLEHPDEGFSYYREEGASSVVCEEKHMGSRAVVFLCRDEEAARNRFGIVGEGIGVVTTRTGRRFFDDLGLESAFLERVRDAATEAKLWDELQTDWMILDCELMPWSAKAQALLREQYAAVGAAAHASTQVALDVAILAGARGVEGASELVGRLGQRRQAAEQFVDSYRRYCWRVSSLDDLRLAPFHILATEGSVHRDKTHLWHMETLARLCAADERLLFRTPYRVVHLNDGGSVAEGVEWWEDMTAKGGEGMVIKPLDFVLRGKRGLAQPAVKCRGREYLRIIYGPEYTLPENLDRLRSRGVGRKRSLALREFALGMEALDRFVRRDPLRRVHECVFGVLALESEPVDPRL